MTSSIPQKSGIWEGLSRFLTNRQSWKIASIHSFYPFFIQYCSLVWCSAAVSHLELLNKNLNAIKFLISNLEIDLWHRNAFSSLCILYKVSHNTDHPVHALLPSWSYIPATPCNQKCCWCSWSYFFIYEVQCQSVF